MTVDDTLARQLRDALNHLHDPYELRRSRLAEVFGVAGRYDTASALQRVLISAIEALKPGPAARAPLQARRTYDLLLYRYVQQFTLQEVADQLGVSVRQLAREQHTALEALACQLAAQFQLDTEECTDNKRSPAASPSAPSPDLDEDLAWLKNLAPETATAPAELLASLTGLLGPVAAHHESAIDITIPEPLPEMVVHPVAARQILLNVLTAALPLAAGGAVRVSARLTGVNVEVEVSCRSAGTSSGVTAASESPDLEMACRLTALCAGTFGANADADRLSWTLAFPAKEQRVVLVIDDNADALQLFQRYASGTRYRVVGTRDAEAAPALAARLSPAAIVLDVMMPQLDGWEVLARLRQHPATASLPIVVCTILPQEELALSLGASGFIRKPVTQQMFLDALEHLLLSAETKPR